MKSSARLNREAFEKSLPALSATIVAAQKAKVTIEPQVVTDVGKRAVEIAAKKPQQDSVWQSVLNFIAYRSFLNSGLAPGTSDFSPYPNARAKWLFDVPLTYYKGEAIHVAFRAGRPVPAERAAVMERIEHHLNADETVGPEFLLIDGTVSLSLDGLRLRNVIFRGSKIIYRGGPIEMKNVYFVNCKFEIPRNPNGEGFAVALLEAASTKFSA